MGKHCYVMAPFSKNVSFLPWKLKMIQNLLYRIKIACLYIPTSFNTINKIILEFFTRNKINFLNLLLIYF